MSPNIEIREAKRVSTGAKESKQAEALTNWRGMNRQHQQEKKRASKQRHSHPGEGRTGSISRAKREQASRGTHRLERGGQQHQQEQKRASKQRHSPTGQRRTGSISRSKREQASRGMSKGAREHRDSPRYMGMSSDNSSLFPLHQA